MSQPHDADAPLGILIVEDNNLLREMFCKALAGRHHVYASARMRDGWRLYLDKKPDIVFLDIHLPDSNGHDLASLIKDANPQTRVVMVTASDTEADRELAELNRADGFIAKPFDKKKIDDCLARFASPRGQQSL